MPTLEDNLQALWAEIEALASDLSSDTKKNWNTHWPKAKAAIDTTLSELEAELEALSQDLEQDPAAAVTSRLSALADRVESLRDRYKSHHTPESKTLLDFWNTTGRITGALTELAVIGVSQIAAAVSDLLAIVVEEVSSCCDACSQKCHDTCCSESGCTSDKCSEKCSNECASHCSDKCADKSRSQDTPSSTPPSGSL